MKNWKVPKEIAEKYRLPSEMPIFKTDGKKTIIDILTESGLCKTRNEARRLIQQGAVSLITTGEK